MTTYADLLYEAAEMLDELAERVRGSGLVIDGGGRNAVQKTAQIREALRTRSAFPALSTEDVERIKKSYDPSGSMYQDIHALADSHEALRRERDTANSIAERRITGWIAGRCDDGSMIWNRVDDREEMTSDQIAWFEARA